MAATLLNDIKSNIFPQGDNPEATRQCDCTDEIDLGYILELGTLVDGQMINAMSVSGFTYLEQLAAFARKQEDATMKDAVFNAILAGLTVDSNIRYEPALAELAGEDIIINGASLVLYTDAEGTIDGLDLY